MDMIVISWVLYIEVGCVDLLEWPACECRATTIYWRWGLGFSDWFEDGHRADGTVAGEHAWICNCIGSIFMVITGMPLYGVRRAVAYPIFLRFGINSPPRNRTFKLLWNHLIPPMFVQYRSSNIFRWDLGPSWKQKPTSLIPLLWSCVVLWWTSLTTTIPYGNGPRELHGHTIGYIFKIVYMLCMDSFVATTNKITFS